MAISLRDLRQDPDKISSLDTSATCCEQCKTELRETLTGKRHIGGKEYCSDCYYEQLGDLVENAPIATPRIRRH